MFWRQCNPSFRRSFNVTCSVKGFSKILELYKIPDVKTLTLKNKFVFYFLLNLWSIEWNTWLYISLTKPIEGLYRPYALTPRSVILAAKHCSSTLYARHNFSRARRRFTRITRPVHKLAVYICWCKWQWYLLASNGDAFSDLWRHIHKVYIWIFFF